MKDLKKIIENLSVSDVRNTFYYLGRYLKQAETFENYKKDIFEDDNRSVPSELVKSTTLKLISFIETTANKKASLFKFEEYLYWINLINDIEINLEPLPSEDLLKKAKSEIENFEKPIEKK